VVLASHSIVKFTWLLLPAILLVGCSRFRHEEHQFVYVSARQVYLRDRVAAVSNRVGMVTNGEALEVVERGKRFTKVRTPKGEIGWLEDHAIIDDKFYAQFQDLNKSHASAPAVATGELRDDLYLHLLPGRETAHFIVLAGNTKVQFLQRGTVAKPAPPGTPVVKSPATDGQSVPAPVVLEDWWLVRDQSGRCGWLLARQLDVDVPEEVGGYAEGQRMVGAYPIAKVMDSAVERKRTKKTDGKPEKTADSQEDVPEPAGPVEHTEYVTFLTPPHSGLPYDFDQLRVFTWSLNHHRYETAYRLHGIRGYMPVKISQETVNGQSMPVFSFVISDNPDIRVDAQTGVTRPAIPRMVSFRMEGNLVRRTGPDMAPIILVHEGDEPGKQKSGAKKAKK